MIYKKATIYREGTIINYELHNNICALCTHNPKRNIFGNCKMINENVTECYKFLEHK